MQRYISLKFPNLKDKIIEKSNGMIRENVSASSATE
jgi:hypothetical protein